MGVKIPVDRKEGANRETQDELFDEALTYVSHHIWVVTEVNVFRLVRVLQDIEAVRFGTCN